MDNARAQIACGIDRISRSTTQGESDAEHKNSYRIRSHAACNLIVGVEDSQHTHQEDSCSDHFVDEVPLVIADRWMRGKTEKFAYGIARCLPMRVIREVDEV